MKQLFLLENSIKNYEWGSTSAIPALCGTPADGKPQAEVWMGAHPQSSSRLVDAREAKAASAPHGEGAAGGTISLDRFIEENPIAALGARDSERFGTLPFLFKLLAAGKPLSIQVHPSLAQAQEGWARENAAGLPVTDAKRNYKDDNHKPEILCALTKFTAMAGFRPLEETVPILEALGLDILAPILAQMKSRNESAGLKTLLEGLFALPPESKEAIFEALPDACTRLEASTIDGVPSSEISTLIKNLMAHYPGDIGVLAPCYLNIVQLQPGEAIFVDAGILHSYVEGLGVELMANSDNVIRGGLTPKHIDVDELMAILRFESGAPALLTAADEPLVRYPTPSREFCLECATLAPRETVFLPAKGARILVAVSGSLQLKTESEVLALEQGQSAFAMASAGEVRVEGSGRLYSARTGDVK